MSLPGEPQYLLGGEGEKIWRKNLLREEWLYSEKLGIEDWEKSGSSQEMGVVVWVRVPKSRQGRWDQMWGPTGPEQE